MNADGIQQIPTTIEPIESTPINWQTEQKPRKPRKPIKKPRPTKKPEEIKKPIPVIQPTPQFQQTNPPQLPFNETPQKNSIENLRETFGYDTLNHLMYKWVNAILILNVLLFLISIIITLVIYLFFNQQIPLIESAILTIMSFLLLVFNFIIAATTLKRNDLIVIRKYRSGAGKISRMNINGKSHLLFDKRDPSSKVLISWSGAITDATSGCKIIQISEGHPTNDNLNEQVTESEWDKDVARLTKAKSVADLAEAELFNQGILGLKWQDLVLIVILLLGLAIMGYLLMGAPDAIAKKTIEGLMNGNLQNAALQAIQQSGLLGPVPVK